MKADHYKTLVREKPRLPGHEHANLGDSCAETCRMLILGSATKTSSESSKGLAAANFFYHDGFLRHPTLANIQGWGVDDFANDQLLPLILWHDGRYPFYRPFPRHEFTNLFIKGTWTLVSPGVWAASRRMWRLLYFFNRVQGLLFNARWRWSDDERMKGKFWKWERSEGKVQDWLNYAIVMIYLKNSYLGKNWDVDVKFNQPVERVLKNIRTYYLEGDDWEPNSQWIVDLYEKALQEFR